MNKDQELNRVSLGSNPFDSKNINSIGNHPSYYTKIFTGPVNSLLLDNLSDKAKSLFLWMIMQLEVDKDYVILDKKKYMIDNKIKSYTTCFNAVKELLMSRIIATSVVKDVYWINTEVIFKGNIINN